MNKIQKFCLVLLMIIAALPLLFLLLVTRSGDQSYSQLNHLQFVLVSHDVFLQSVFWLTTALLVILLIALIVVIFYPRAKSEFTIRERNGRLAIKSRAIKGLVAANLSEEDFVSQPTITVESSRRKIKVMVKGNFKRTSAILQQTAGWTDEVRRQIHSLLGEEYPIQIDVQYQQFEKPKKYQAARVE